MITTSNMAPRLRRIGLTLGAVGIVALVAAALPELTSAGEVVVAAAASPATIKIDNFTFAPATLTVTAGTTVTWKNEDDSPHRIGDKNGAFKSAALDTDETFSYTFASPGEYPYICTIHPYNGREDHRQTSRQGVVELNSRMRCEPAALVGKVRCGRRLARLLSVAALCFV